MENKKFFALWLLAFGGCTTVVKQNMDTGDAGAEPSVIIIDQDPSVYASAFQAVVEISRDTEYFIRHEFVIASGASGAAGAATRCVDAAAHFTTAASDIITAITTADADVAHKVVNAAADAADPVDVSHVARHANNIVRTAAAEAYAARDAGDATLARVHASAAAAGVIAAIRFFVKLVHGAIEADADIAAAVVHSLRSVRAGARAFDLPIAR